MRGEKKRIYPRLAFTGIAKNSRTYGPYLLTCIGMVMMYYIMEYLKVSEHIRAMRGGATLQEMLRFGSGVFVVFILIFLFYTNTFLIKNRKREFGLYNILGMGKWNLARILIWESLIMLIVSLAGGLFCGVLFSKVAELLMAKVLESEITLTFGVETGAAVRAVVLFAAVFGVILVRALFEVGRSKPIDLLHSSSVGEKPPKGNWVLALLGTVILAAAYYIAVSIENPMSAFLAFFLAVAMVIIATYLLFIAGSVVLCRLLQKKKSYYYKANHFVSVSSMMYRMKRNGAGLASICILSTMVLVMISAVTCLYVGKEDQMLSRYPRQIEFYEYTFDDKYIDLMKQAIAEVLEEQHVTKVNEMGYRYLGIGGYFDGDQVILNEEKMVDELGVFDYADVKEMYFLPLSEYNRFTGASETLADGEVLVYGRKSDYEYDTITLEGCSTWKVRKAEQALEIGDDAALAMDSLFFVMKDEAAIDEVYGAQKEIYGRNASSLTYYYGFDLKEDETVQKQVAIEIDHRLSRLCESDNSFPNYRNTCRAASRADFYGLYGGLFVLGILLGIVFLAATVLIMYYKQVTEGFEDQARFDIMQKVGMTKKEIRSSIHSQMFTVFLLPLLLAGVHTGFAFPIVEKLLRLFGLLNAGLLILTTLVCFLVFAAFYTLVYLGTSRAYYRIVSANKE